MSSSADSSRRNADDIVPLLKPYAHKVGVAPKQSMFEEIKSTFNEIFLYDDPFRSFENQMKSTKFLLWIRAIFPILDWGRSYKLHMFKGDLIAGLTIASLVIPQGIGYAKLANLDPQFGLYTSFVPPLIYAVMGSSRDIAVGPTAVTSLMLGNMLRKEIDPQNKIEYQRLAFTATFFVGVTQFTIGFLRLGFLIEYLSHAAIVGFTGGAAISIGLQQLKGLLGIKKFTNQTDIISVMCSVWSNAHHGWNLETILIGVTFLAFLLFANYIGKKNKKLFWISAIAPLLSVVISTLFVFLTHAENNGVQIVNHIDKGINPSSAHEIHFTGGYAATGFRIGAITGMVALTEAVAIGKTFAAIKDYQLDGNREMVALGAMNIVGSMTSCYVATGSISRSAVNFMAGCNTIVSNIVMSCVVFLTLEVIAPLFKYTPNAILASIIISALVGLFDYKAMIHIWKIDKFDFLACIGAFFGVVFASVEIGLLIAVAISFAKILLQVSRPQIAVLGKIPGTTAYKNIHQYPEATKVPGVMIVQVDSAIYFSNSTYIRERILRLLIQEEEELKRNSQLPIKYLIIDMSAVADIDTSGVHAMEDLCKSLRNREVELVLANLGLTVLDKLHKSAFIDTIGDDNIFLTVEDAVITLSPQLDP